MGRDGRMTYAEVRRPAWAHLGRASLACQHGGAAWDEQGSHLASGQQLTKSGSARNSSDFY